MIKYILEYKNRDYYHNRYLFIETYMEYIDNQILVEISDFTCKNGAIEKDWIPMWVILKKNDNNLNKEFRKQLLNTSSNPKYKFYTKEEFDNMFNIIEEYICK